MSCHYGSIMLSASAAAGAGSEPRAVELSPPPAPAWAGPGVMAWQHGVTLWMQTITMTG